MNVATDGWRGANWTEKSVELFSGENFFEKPIKNKIYFYRYYISQNAYILYTRLKYAQFVGVYV